MKILLPFKKQHNIGGEIIETISCTWTKMMDKTNSMVKSMVLVRPQLGNKHGTIGKGNL